MILDTESWRNIRRFRALHVAGATFAEIGCDWRNGALLVGDNGANFATFLIAYTQLPLLKRDGLQHASNSEPAF